MESVILTSFFVSGPRLRYVVVTREYGPDTPEGRPFRVRVGGPTLTPEEVKAARLPGDGGEVYYRTSRIALIRARVFASRLAVAGA